jgi:hypothetical protein
VRIDGALEVDGEALAEEGDGDGRAVGYPPRSREESLTTDSGTRFM